jgi:hypothetical protein
MSEMLGTTDRTWQRRSRRMRAGVSCYSEQTSFPGLQLKCQQRLALIRIQHEAAFLPGNGFHSLEW